VIVFEEAREFDEETVNAILVAVRGIKNQVEIYRSNPYLLNNWFLGTCGTSWHQTLLSSMRSLNTNMGFPH
jgi:hypothetical protein